MLRRELLIGAVGIVLAAGARGQQIAPKSGGQDGTATPPLWGPPHSRQELEHAERRFGFRFPPDLFEFLLKRRFARSPDWTKDEADIRELLDWPAAGILMDIEQNDFWSPHWGPRPDSLEERVASARKLVEAAPKLIPLAPNIYIPEAPAERDNPIFFLFLTDVRYYAANLGDYIERIAIPPRLRGPVKGQRKHIPFWTALSTIRVQSPRRPG